MSTVRHPATAKLFRDAAARFMTLRRQHARACDAMWAGTLASQFTAAEVALLTDYLSPRDRTLLASVKRATS